MNGTSLAAIKTRLALWSNDANRDKGTITTYSLVMKHLIRHYASAAFIAKAEEVIRTFKQGSLTRCNFS